MRSTPEMQVYINGNCTATRHRIKKQNISYKAEQETELLSKIPSGNVLRR